MDTGTELVKYYRWLRQYGLNDSHSGNASIRVADTIWVTPTGCCADTLAAQDLVQCSFRKKPGKSASLDALLHLAVYQQNPDARAILHSHGAYSIAATLAGEDFIPVDFEGGLYFPRVPVISISYEKYMEQAAGKVSAALAESPIAVVRGHGVYAWGENLDQAYKWTCSFEQSAKISLLALEATP